jgi:hypothetical protein
MDNTKPTPAPKRQILRVKRNNYSLELLPGDLDRESDEIAQAAQELTALVSKNAALKREDAAWLNASLLNTDDRFDAAAFERQFQAVNQVGTTSAGNAVHGR